MSNNDYNSVNALSGCVCVPKKVASFTLVCMLWMRESTTEESLERQRTAGNPWGWGWGLGFHQGGKVSGNCGSNDLAEGWRLSSTLWPTNESADMMRLNKPLGTGDQVTLTS